MKRVYKQVTVEAVDGEFEVRLDGRPVRTPARLPLRLPTAALAEAVRTEWDDQTTEVKPDRMPQTQLASTALDRVGPQREAIVDGVLAYAETDLLCYRADQPPTLAQRQAETWQPLLDWAALRHDALLRVTAGIIPVEQDRQAVSALRHAVEALDSWTLTGLQNAVASAGSLVIGLALVDGRIGAAEAFEAAELDASYEIEKWGEDEEAMQRRAALRADLEATERFLALLK
jgi:chaperone required for assembly of F1-ATPase